MAPKSCFFLHCFNNYFSRLFNSKYGSKWPGTNCCTGFWWILNSTTCKGIFRDLCFLGVILLVVNLKLKESLRVEKKVTCLVYVFILMAIRTNSATISVR